MGDTITAALFAGPELLDVDSLRAFVRRVIPDAVAGHAFGDLAALVAADVLDHRDALRLAQLRDPRGELARCLEAPVLWSQTVRALSAAGTGEYVDAGCEGMLSDLARQTLSGAQPAGVESELAHAT